MSYVSWKIPPPTAHIVSATIGPVGIDAEVAFPKLGLQAHQLLVERAHVHPLPQPVADNHILCPRTGISTFFNKKT